MDELHGLLEANEEVVSEQWWCVMRQAWIDEHDRIVETAEALVARRKPVPDTVGRWFVEAIKALLWPGPSPLPRKPPQDPQGAGP